jgi:hypothetical protein
MDQISTLELIVYALIVILTVIGVFVNGGPPKRR